MNRSCEKMDNLEDTQENCELADLSIMDLSVPTIGLDLLDGMQDNDFDPHDSDKDPEIQPGNLESTDSSDQSEGRDIPMRKKNRVAKTSPDWANVKRKAIRNNGEEFTTKTGKTVNRRQVDVIATCPCKYKCSDTFSHEDRLEINSGYWGLGTYADQKHFIDKNVIESPCHRKIGSRPSKRSFTWKYTLKEKQVCKSFFLKTINISDTVVVNCKKKVRLLQNIGEDLRGKAQASRKTIDKDVIDRIHQHIKRFPMVESHYCRKSTNRMYLQSDLNLTKMFDLFTGENRGLKVKVCTYRRVFKEYNLAFHKPKKDQCSTCVKFGHATDIEKENLQAAYNHHLKNKEASRAAKEVDKDMAKKDTSVKVFTFDLQKVLPSPCGEISNFYYSRKFATYIHRRSTTWPQQRVIATCGMKIKQLEVQTRSQA